MSVHINSGHLAQAEALVAGARSHGGLARLDIERFWADQEKAAKDPFAIDCPQVPVGMGMSVECVFAELSEREDWYRLFHDEDYRIGLSVLYNNQAEKIIGRRPLSETKQDPWLKWPPIKELHDIFEARNTWHQDSYWLQQSANTEGELEALLDRVDERLQDLRSFMLPANWQDEKERILATGGSVPLYRAQRGPVTFAMSVYGIENLIFLLADNPALAVRFSETILRAMLARAMVLDEEAGLEKAAAARGFYFCDDNCALLNADMYETFGYPVLKGVFDRYSPFPVDMRGQHSDSDMAHHLPVLGRLDLTHVNFGPNLTVAQIRERLPRAVIQGQLAPFTFSRNEEVNIVAEFLRDFEMAREKRGLAFATAGSINNGSRLTGMRLIMAAIQEYGRYA